MKYATSVSFALIASFLTTLAYAEVREIRDANGEKGLTVFQMTVTPAAEPVPALKHRFVLPLHKRKPGNAAVHYLRGFAGVNLRGTWKTLQDKYGEEVESWYSLEVPIQELPLAKLEKAAGTFDRLIRDYVDHASRCRRCDWGLEEMDLQGPEIIAYLLADAQESREVCRAIALASRLAVAEGRYDDAIELMRMNYQLGQDYSKQRFLVCSLIGIAEVGVANKTAIDLIAAKNSPNLYWALSELPRPVVNMREAISLEMSLGLRIFPELLEVENAQHSPEEWARLLTEAIKGMNELDGFLFSGIGYEDRTTFYQLAATGIALVAHPSAKERLVESGMDPIAVEEMAVGHVLLLDAAREYQRIADEYEKGWYVPYRAFKQHIRPERAFSNNKFQGGFGNILAQLLLPAVGAARTAQMRTQWQIDALRTVEALRMHASETGEFPKSLAEIKVVPVPKNPITQEEFQYRLDGNKAILDLPFSDGMPGTAWRFELSLTE